MKKDRIAELQERFLAGIGVPPPEPFVTDSFQKEAIDLVSRGEDVLVVAPTGSGKTHIALQAMKAILAQGKKAVYTTPLKALSNTKFADFKLRFEPQFRVGLLTGDRKIDGHAEVVIATTEIYRNELYRGGGRFGLIVLDEVHFIADPQRGPVWEESIILSRRESALLMLSASISNAAEIAAWIGEVRGRSCHIVMKRDRPVELRYGFLHPDLGVLPLAEKPGVVTSEVARYYAERQGEDLRPRGRGQSRGGGGRSGHRGGRPRRRGGRS